MRDDSDRETVTVTNLEVVCSALCIRRIEETANLHS